MLWIGYLRILISRSTIQIGSDLFLAPLRGMQDFMQKTGGGYGTLADWLIKLDKINPQPTARSCSAFDSWRIFAPERQTQMQTAMQRILIEEDLSRDTREMLTRILGEDG